MREGLCADVMGLDGIKDVGVERDRTMANARGKGRAMRQPLCLLLFALSGCSPDVVGMVSFLKV